MKTFERSIGCRDIRREIEEAGQDEALSPPASFHLKACGECETFFDQQFKLRAIVASLGTVPAPNDFEFRLRARLAGEKRSTPRPFAMGNFSFGLRAAAIAVILVLVGSTFLALRLRPDTNHDVVADVSQSEVKPSVPPLGAKNGDGQAAPPSVNLTATQSDGPANSSETRPRKNPDRGGAGHLAVAKRNGSRIMGQSVAPVLVADGHSMFPIDAAPQALKVSVDNGRGTPRTISVPGVSFGSQRVLNQNPTPLMASSRGAW